ncbi:hypothetical protein D917_03521 [Trichinella nativa]|uniref:Uncharacterized protein n=1 Tax=Trichinella nativa TaxID=6335 RepID=A0A1Y3E987_9BILA|nr:hypothetical protein D917_03521 [Trichinella nativa]
MALQVRFVEGSQVEVPFQSNDSGTIDHGDDVDDDYDHEYNNHRESFSLYEEDGSTSAMKMSHFIRRISLYNPIVSGGDDVDPNKQVTNNNNNYANILHCLANDVFAETRHLAHTTTTPYYYPPSPHSWQA